VCEAAGMNRRLVIAGLLALVVVGAILLVRALMPDERFIFGTAAVGRDEGLLLTRRNEDRSTAFWLEHVDLAGQLRWSVELSPLEPDDSLGFTSVAAAEDRVIVMGQREGEDVALALDRASGRQLWETVLPGIRATGGPIAPTVLIDGPRVYLVRESQDEAGLDIRVDAVALADGAALWRFEPGEAGDVRLLAPGRLMVASRGGGGMILAGATGESTQQMAKTRVLCAVPEGLLASDLGAATLVPAVADGPPWRAELEPPWRIGYGPCGVRDEDPVLGTRSGADEHVGLVRVDRRTGLPRWRLDLETTQADPILTLDGRLPRFLPVAVYGSHGEQELRNELVIVDLDAGVVVNRKTIVQHVEVLATPARAWLWVQFKNTLAGLDPATGELASATAFAEFSGNDIRHDDLQFGVLWLHSMRWDRPARLPWAAVDLATGEVLHAGPQVVTRDESAAIQSMLGG
jgi:hypothetical protein